MQKMHETLISLNSTVSLVLIEAHGLLERFKFSCPDWPVCTEFSLSSTSLALEGISLPDVSFRRYEVT